MTISVITVSKNAASTIAATIESVRNQKTKHTIEHILVDGNSKDSTPSIIKDYIDRPSNIIYHYIHGEDNNMYEAMNKGIAHATGCIIGFLNADDTYSSAGTLNKIAEYIEGYDAVYADVVYRKNGVVVRRYNSSGFKRGKMLCGIMPAHPTFYCRTNLLKQEHGFDTRLRIAADFELMFRLIYLKNIKIKYIPFIAIEMTSGGISGKGVKSHIRIIWDHMFTYFKHGCYEGLFKDWLRYPSKILELRNEN